MKIKDGRNVASPLRLLFGLLAAGLLLAQAAPARAEGANNDKIKDALKLMKEEVGKLGESRLEGWSLFFGNTKMNGNYLIVDSLKTRFNCVATIFAAKGTNYVRISTNVLDEGDRAVGTVLDPKGAAYAAISKGEAFFGTVDILGKKYQAGYEPIKNTAGETVGVYFVGFTAE